MALSVMTPIDTSSITRMSTARSTGQSLPIPLTASSVTSGSAAASTSACTLTAPSLNASSAIASA